MNKEMQIAIEKAYSSIVLYREALTNAFLNGYISLDVKMKSDLFFTANFLERVLAGEQQQPTCTDKQYIDRECATLDAMCMLYPEQFEAVKPQLEAIEKAFATWQSILN